MHKHGHAHRRARTHPQAQVRSNIASIRREVRQARLRRLVIVGHSLGGCYAQEVARLLLMEMPRLDIHVRTFGSPTVFARRDGRGTVDSRSERVDVRGRDLWKTAPTWWDSVLAMMWSGGGGRVKDDELMRRLRGRSVHVVHRLTRAQARTLGRACSMSMRTHGHTHTYRWDVMPRVHLLPQLLRHSHAKAMLNAFTKHLAAKFGGAYAARLGGCFILLAIPHLCVPAGVI